jgi:hypothetical protein
MFPLLLVIGINYKYDPANLFDSKNDYEHRIADFLLSGFNVTDITNMDERKLQQFFIEGMVQSPDVIERKVANRLQNINVDYTYPNSICPFLIKLN